MANDYITTTEAKNRLPDASWTTAYDNMLTSIITEVSREIDLFTKRKPGAYEVDAEVTRYYNGSGCRELWIGEWAEVSTVAVAETGVVDGAGGTGGTYTTWSATDYYLWPYNAADDGRPYLRLDIDQLNGSKSVWYNFPRGVKITGKPGYSTSAPGEVVRAAIIQTIKSFKRAQQAYQDTGAIVELGQLRYVKALDPEVAEIIDHLREVTI